MAIDRQFNFRARALHQAAILSSVSGNRPARLSTGAAIVSTYLTGGAIDTVFASLKAAVADLNVERHQVSNPNDDNNLWFISAAGLPEEVQIDAHPGGQPPFLIEGHGEGQRLNTSNVDQAVETILTWMASRG